MRAIAGGLSARFRVYSLDLPGHGRSPEPPDAWGVPAYAGLVSRFVTRHRLQPLPILGHSNGGRIALYMASDPEMSALVSKLVLISPSGMKPVRTLAYYIKRTIAELLKAPARLLPPKWRSPVLAWLKRSVLWKALGSSDYRHVSGVMRDTFVKTVNCFLEDRVGRISVPVLVFWGENDASVSEVQVNRLVGLLPDAGLVRLPEAGHFGFIDRPDIVIAGTQHFLSDKQDDNTAKNSA